MASTLPAPGEPKANRRTPTYFFREENTNLIVKGNFMTLAAKPEYVDRGEWMAHQGTRIPCCSPEDAPLTCLHSRGTVSTPRRHDQGHSGN